MIVAYPRPLKNAENNYKPINTITFSNLKITNTKKNIVVATIINDIKFILSVTIKFTNILPIKTPTFIIVIYISKKLLSI